MQSDRLARIRDRAYQIWVVEGRVHGRDDVHWQRAEREIAEEDRKSGAKTSGAAVRPRAKPAGAKAAAAATGKARAKATPAVKKAKLSAGPARSSRAANPKP